MTKTREDFAPKWDWKALMPLIVEDRKAGLSLSQLSTKYGPPFPSISTHLKAYYKKNPADNPATEKPKTETEAPSLPATSLDASRIAAREMLHQALTGQAQPTAQQIAAARLVLKDELEPTDERNPYAGTSEDELAERILTLAASILGVERCSAILKALAQDGQADVLKYDGPALTEREQVVAMTTRDSVGIIESIAPPMIEREAAGTGQPFEPVAQAGAGLVENVAAGPTENLP